MQCYYWLLVVTLLHTAAGQLDPVEQDSILDLARVLSPLPGNWSTTNASDACSSWQGITCSSNHVVYVVLYPGFSGVLPASIGNLSLLTTLDLRQNLIVGTIPPEIGKLQNLRTLYLHQNLLLGTIPKELGQLSNLQYCYLYGNVLSGTIPAEFSNCQNLLQLDLSGNKLDGTIPKAILSLPKCTTLSLLNNLLTGEIPSEVENLAQVTYLALSQNALSGTIPKTIGNLGKLTQLNLFSNSLTGTIPNEMSNLRALRYLYLNSNKLSGTIPNDIGKLSQLNYLYMHDNNLEGTLPESIGNLTNIQYFYVSTNRLSGTIPSSLGNLTNLISLYFYDNQFTGTIPDISRLSRLQALHLRTNFLTGTIPAYFGNFTLLSQLHLHYNGLSGTIPSELGNLQYLTDLYLYNNPLTGTIPESLGQLSRLKSLYLSVSQLNGTVPASFANLTSLTTLYLGSTNLHGCFDANMTALTLCDVSYTWLECFPSVCTYSPPPVAVPVDQIGGNTPQDQTEIIRLAVGISVPIGAALIAGIIVLIVLLARRAKKKKQEEIMLRDPNRKPLSDVLPARMIINYSDLKIVRELGAGDFGKVFEGRWQNAQVAVKINTDGDWASFYNEAELMLNLRPHPNVVQTLGYCDHGGKLIVVLEYCNGGSLDNRLFDDDTTVDNADKLELMYNIASGISHLHANKIIHRDLAARNILLSHGIAKVADFGLSRRVEEINRHSQTKSVLGPIRWMAPESLANAFYNEKTDVWSFGIVCAEILNRCEPHLNEDPLTVAAKIRDDFVTPPINGDCDPQLVRLLKDCWNPDPQKRPDMKTICSRLEELLQVNQQKSTTDLDPAFLSEVVELMSRAVQVTSEQVIKLLQARLPNFGSLELFQPIPKPGRVNTVYKVDTSNGDGSRSSFILKVTNPTWCTRKTRNEARILIELSKKTNLPVSKVVCYEADRTHSEIAHEFILLEYLEGVLLGEVWSTMTEQNQFQIIAEIADIIKTFRTLEFDAIGNFTDDFDPWKVGNIVALEWRSDEEIKRCESVKMIGPLHSFKEYILNYLLPHFDMIERRNDPRVMPYLEAARQFCNKVIMKGDMTSPLQERFVFTHGDFNEGNILVTKNSAGFYTITGLLDFEWAMSGPEEIEFHRGFRWIKQAEPKLREVYWRILWSELTARGVHKSACYEEREDICSFERMISHLESYCDYFPNMEEREIFLTEKLRQLHDLLKKFCGPLPEE